MGWRAVGSCSLLMNELQYWMFWFCHNANRNTHKTVSTFTSYIALPKRVTRNVACTFHVCFLSYSFFVLWIFNISSYLSEELPCNNFIRSTGVSSKKLSSSWIQLFTHYASLWSHFLLQAMIVLISVATDFLRDAGFYVSFDFYSAFMSS